MKEAAAWLAERLADERDRFFRLGPAPLAPRPSASSRRRIPAGSRTRCAGLAVSRRRRYPSRTWPFASLPSPSSSSAFARVLRRRRVFDFDGEVAGLSRVEQAVAFLALLELRKAARSRSRRPPRSLRSASRIPRTKGSPVDRPLRLICRETRSTRSRAPSRRCSSSPRRRSRSTELVDAAEDDPERVETALGLLARALPRGPERHRARARRRRLRLPRRARGGRGVRPPVRAARRARALAGGARDARDRRLPRPRLPTRRSRASAASPPTRPSPRSSSAA